jgi:hypothetical protein
LDRERYRGRRGTPTRDGQMLELSELDLDEIATALADQTDTSTSG